jgi:hypothetical protein
LLVAAIAATLTSAHAQTYRITGTLTDTTQSAPIPHGHLSATPDKPCQPSAKDPETDSDPDGRFTLAVPCAGTWRLTADAPNFAPQTFEQHDAYSTGIVLSPAQSSMDLAFRITPKSSITGFVLDEIGDPVRDAKVTLLSASDAEPKPVGSATTDDRGFYEFPNLLPGSYQVAVQTQPWYALAAHPPRRFNIEPTPASDSAPTDPSLDLTYPITWFPGVADPASAGTLELAGGGAQQADIHLSPIPSIHLILPGTGGASGRPLGFEAGRRPATLPPIQQISPLGETEFRPTSVNVNADGSINIAGFSPGTYALTHMGPRSRDAASQEIFDIQKDSPRTLNLPSTRTAAASPADPTLQLNGKAFIQHNPAQGAMLLLVPTALNETHITRAQTNTDGSFTFEHLAPGNYILVAIDHGWSVDWRTPATLTPYLLRGTPVHLTNSTTLKQPLEAESP